jgi:hypothetical protein
MKVFYYFCLMIEGSVHRTNGSGSGRPKNIRIIRIRIRIPTLIFEISETTEIPALDFIYDNSSVNSAHLRKLLAINGATF